MGAHAPPILMMKNQPVTDKAGLKREWQLSQSAFHRMLVWLDEGDDTGGQGYLEIRRRLVLYFDRKNCSAPEDLADETLNRVARRLEEEGEIIGDAPAQYCYIVARFVFLENVRRQSGEVSFDEPATSRAAERMVASAGSASEDTESEQRSQCLERCMEQLSPDQRDLIVRYYTGEQRAKLENRKALAAALGITSNALSIRACRIRDKLEACVSQCLGGQ